MQHRQYWRWLFLFMFGVIMVGCQALLPVVPTPVSPGATPTPFTATPTTAPRPMAWGRYFPDPAISGDVLTFDVRFPSDGPLPLTATLYLPTQDLEAKPDFWTLDGTQSVRWVWAWDTSGYVGTVPVTVTLVWDDAGATSALTLPVTLAAPETRSPYEQQARWTMAEVPGVRLHYLTGSAAARDLERLKAEARDAYADISAALGANQGGMVEIYILDRVYGQGGYATSDWVAITYTDRNYAPARLDLVLRHELVHRLDRALGCDSALTLLREGLAVYLSGGHYHPAPETYYLSTLRAAGLYIPLSELVQNFYTHQHEIGYLEAASFVAFVESTYGREGVRTLCTVSGGGQEGQTELARLQRGLAALGYADVAEAEQAWWAWAERTPAVTGAAEALHTLTFLVDTMRAYQQAYDPVAYYLTGMLPDPAWAENYALPAADFVRAPQQAEAVALELLLAQAMRAYESGHVERAEALASTVQAVLERGFPASGFPTDVARISQSCLQQGYTPYAVTEAPDGRYVVLATRWDGEAPRRWVLLAQGRGGAWEVSPLLSLD